MARARHSTHERRRERGSALIGVLLLLMRMSALVATLGVSGRTETLVARNHQSGAQAQAAAEAGLNHAVQVIVANIAQWQSNGFANVDAALDALLANGGSLETVVGWGVAIGTRIPIAGPNGVEYEAVIMDEDDVARGADATQILGDGDATNNEDGNALNDANRTLVLQATGYARDNTAVTLEALVAPVPLPAIASNGDFTVDGGSLTVSGLEGDVHANGDLIITGNPTISGDGSASGSLNCYLTCHQIQGTATAGAATRPIPAVRAIDYKPLATHVLQADGWLIKVDGSAPPCYAGSSKNACRAAYGWVYDGDGWSVGSPGAHPLAAFYVEGIARVSGNPGGSGIQMTIMAEGSIDVGTGGSTITPHAPELLFVTDGNLKITGNMSMTAQAQILVHEQIHIGGNPSLSAQILIENATSVSTLVTTNLIGSSADITYNGGLGGGSLGVASWRTSDKRTQT